MHLRDLGGFVDTRHKLLTQKPANRANWIAFAVGHHLDGNHEIAAQVLAEFAASGRSALPAQIIGTVKSVPGVAGSAVSFNAKPAGRLVIPINLTSATKGVFTVEFWLRVSAKADSYGTCIDAGSNKGFVIRTNNSGRLSVSAGGQWNAIATALPLVEQSWTHVALTSDDTTIRLYVDGREAGIFSPPNPLFTSTSLQLGSVVERIRQPDNSVIEGTVKQLIGDLDELKIYDRVLTPAEIANAAQTKAKPAR